ncbi:hypothetical protein LRP67_16185 [Nocardioides sp. cx-169]|uniref:hypothetical protein n=1 Tax=Nocardioides sp. cx-169 TaxID=2899080 RepID=UPI001E5A7AC7|nr:hypothetical protein [Nocardioides sp. cx-169]MCD4535632.1 hypothetical protein [Nocardioides sp. cx-169]
MRHTARASTQANADTVSATEQATAVQALESMTLNLLQPYRDEVDRLRQQMLELSAARTVERIESDRKSAEERTEREQKAAEIQDQIARQSERIDILTVEVKHWKGMARAIARWATTLRDQVLALGGTVPTLPDELLVAQLLDEDDHL